MGNYFVCLSFAMKTPTGDQILRKGDEIIIPATKAGNLITRGLIVDKHVGLDLLARYQHHLAALIKGLGCSSGDAACQAEHLVVSLLRRHESLKSFKKSSTEFIAELEEFNRIATGPYPVSKIPSKNGAGEWGGYRCNFCKGCSHGCKYCYAENMAIRFKIIDGKDAWLNETVIPCTTANRGKKNEPIMFPTTHDITEANLHAYRCHLYNLLESGNKIVLVSKPHRTCIEAICREIEQFRDNIVFRFSIGSLENETLHLWEPGAPSLNERLGCLRYVFEKGFQTSVSAEPMLTDRAGAEQLYYAVEPYVTDSIWFGKMSTVGRFLNNDDPELVASASFLKDAYKDAEIMQLVNTLDGLPKVCWKDSIKEVIEKNNLLKRYI